MRTKWRQWASEGAFRHKLILTSIACLLVPTLMTMSVYNLLTRNAVKEEAMQNAQIQLQLVDVNVSGLLKYMVYVSNYIMVDPEINYILKEQAAGKQYTGEHAEYLEFSILYRVTSKIDNISIVGEKTYVTILLPNGKFFINYPMEEYDPRLLFQEEWFKELDRLQGTEGYWVGTHPSPYLHEKTAGRHQISLARTLRRPNRDIYAYVIVTVTENQIHRYFQHKSPGQEIMLVDEHNRIMSHADTSRIGSTLDVLADIGDGRPGIISLNNRNYLLTTQPIAVSGWKLVMLMPYKEAVWKINDIFQTVFVYQLIIFAVFLVLLVWLIRRFTHPLVKLGRLARTVERGNLDVRSHIRGRDEIGRLGRSFDQMLDRINEMIAEITAEQTRKRKAELAMLQAQIHPHFLFNVLNSIRMKILRKGDKESAEMLAMLSRLLRMTISREEESISLHEEVSTLIDYVKLMNMRQKEPVRLEIDVSSEAMLVQVPRFFLQPLIENALIHGHKQRSGTIALTAKVVNRNLLITVEDDGSGMDPDTLSRLRDQLKQAQSGMVPEGTGSHFSGIGLANVYERLRIRFGPAFRMEIDSKPGTGTVVSLHIPLGEGKGNEV